MSRLFPPNRFPGRRLLGFLVLLLPVTASAEVVLSTSVERISTAVPLSTEPTSNSAADPSGAEVATPVPASGAPEPMANAEPSEVFSGDVLRYTIAFENTSTQDVAPGSVVITNPLPDETLYLEGSAAGADTLITYSVDGETFGDTAEITVGEGTAIRAATASDVRAIRWTYEPLLPAGASSEVSFELLIP